MNKILASILLGTSLLSAVPAQARDHRWGVDANHHSPYHRPHHHHGGGGWVVPLIIGGIVGAAVVSRPAQAEPTPPPVYVHPLAEPQIAQTCTTREVYDQYNRLISRERFCN